MRQQRRDGKIQELEFVLTEEEIEKIVLVVLDRIVQELKKQGCEKQNEHPSQPGRH